MFITASGFTILNNIGAIAITQTGALFLKTLIHEETSLFLPLKWLALTIVISLSRSLLSMHTNSVLNKAKDNISQLLRVILYKRMETYSFVTLGGINELELQSIFGIFDKMGDCLPKIVALVSAPVA